jgi:hypothetical protein
MSETSLERIQSKRNEIAFEFEDHRFTQGHLRTIKREMMGELPIQCYLHPRVRAAVEKRISQGDI